MSSFHLVLKNEVSFPPEETSISLIGLLLGKEVSYRLSTPIVLIKKDPGLGTSPDLEVKRPHMPVLRAAPPGSLFFTCFMLNDCSFVMLTCVCVKAFI